MMQSLALPALMKRSKVQNICNLSKLLEFGELQTKTETKPILNLKILTAAPDLTRDVFVFLGNRQQQVNKRNMWLDTSAGLAFEKRLCQYSYYDFWTQERYQDPLKRYSARLYECFRRAASFKLNPYSRFHYTIHSIIFTIQYEVSCFKSKS